MELTASSVDHKLTHLCWSSSVTTQMTRLMMVQLGFENNVVLLPSILIKSCQILVRVWLIILQFKCQFFFTCTCIFTRRLLVF